MGTPGTASFSKRSKSENEDLVPSIREDKRATISATCSVRPSSTGRGVRRSRSRRCYEMFRERINLPGSAVADFSCDGDSAWVVDIDDGGAIGLEALGKKEQFSIQKLPPITNVRSEERRVGKECRYRWGP